MQHFFSDTVHNFLFLSARMILSKSADKKFFCTQAKLSKCYDIKDFLHRTFQKSMLKKAVKMSKNQDFCASQLGVFNKINSEKLPYYIFLHTTFQKFDILCKNFKCHDNHIFERFTFSEFL